LQKLANSPVIAIAEGYATAATVAKYGNVPAIAAFDAGNLPTIWRTSLASNVAPSARGVKLLLDRLTEST
jgi:phage/plasmid primase-like uncharacterized protein